MTSEAPATAGLVARIHTLIGSLSPAEARVAGLIAENPAGTSQHTIEELAQQASTSTATVVRTAKRLGYQGYPQLRLALAAQPTGQTRESSLAADVRDEDNPYTVLQKLTAFERDAIRATSELADPAVLDTVVGLLTGARRIDVYGIGASGLVAMDLSQKLQRIGLYCMAHTEHDAGMVSAVLLGSDDVAIGISHTGTTPGTLLPLRRARNSGATAVALTGASGSALAQDAEHTLLTAGRELGFRSAAMASRTSQLLIVDCLFVAVAQRTASARDALMKTHDAISSAGDRRQMRKEDQ
ncbi:DNA-binding MurR/RpiR family transcriptional regulator [Arthrobacter pigmenti]|uniref:DNA-binding MurR/RpiR family transcriptional regulator n=1 Tax=Arthrobacter pigmenti TaxID=271432 RepID=A0A846RVC8_9MICC|nr:MurR/RpiR family transcriptional regulator [Arthrobacter pigmenti]NJC24442.1 DNA-binding MurR/RpiR family transcriptional regulator [Arthrobacter pigmenti]